VTVATSVINKGGVPVSTSVVNNGCVPFSTSVLIMAAWLSAQV
jgi:hypothetical protein